MAKEHTILTLDLGLDCGWSFIRAGVITHSGTKSMKGKFSHPGDRFLKFHNWLVRFATVKEIIYEDIPFFSSNASARVYCGLLCIVQMFCKANGIRMVNIKASSVKKEFAGHGRAEKGDMCKTAHTLGWKGGHLGTEIGHDECDAVAIGWVVLRRRGVTPIFKHQLTSADVQ